MRLCTWLFSRKQKDATKSTSKGEDAWHLLASEAVKNESVTFGLVILFIGILQATVLARGLISLSADELARLLYAADWAHSPYLFGDPVWLPGHFYLLGLALKIHYDLLLTPRIVTMAFSFTSLVMLYLLTRNLFNRWVAILTVLIVGLLPLHVHLSLIPLVEIIYFAFIISFLYFFFIWLDRETDMSLLLAALMLSLATGLRYEGWLIAAIFSLYLTLCWLTALYGTRSLHLLWLLAIALVCLPPSVVILRNYILWGDPLHFVQGETFRFPVDMSGPLTRLSPKLGYIDLLMRHGALICWIALGGIILSYRRLAHLMWLYLAFSLGPLLGLTLLMKSPEIWAAYAPRFIGLYLILLTPFCAYALYWAITVQQRVGRYRWETAGWGILAIMSLYNLWLVYLRVEGHSWLLICLLALAGCTLSYRLLGRKDWLYFTCSLVPFPILIIIAQRNFISDPIKLLEVYFIFLALVYVFKVWCGSRVVQPLAPQQWRIVGVGLLVVICFYNLWGALTNIPDAAGSAIRAGLRLRQLFEASILAEDDKVLIESATWPYQGIQVMSNHLPNFVLDRLPDRGEESFLLDKASSPHAIGAKFSHYEPQVNPFALDPPMGLEAYFKSRQIRLVVVKDPRLEAVILQQTMFKRIDQVRDYVFYYATKDDLH